MPDTPLHYQTITEVAGQIQAKELSPVELTRTILDRIQSLDGQLMSYATVMADQALASAQRRKLR
jgi:amidase